MATVARSAAAAASTTSAATSSSHVNSAIMFPVETNPLAVQEPQQQPHRQRSRHLLRRRIQSRCLPSQQRPLLRKKSWSHLWGKRSVNSMVIPSTEKWSESNLSRNLNPQWFPMRLSSYYNLRRLVIGKVLSTKIWGVPRPAWAVGSYSSGPPAGGTPQILVDKTLRITSRLRV